MKDIYRIIMLSLLCVFLQPHAQSAPAAMIRSAVVLIPGNSPVPVRFPDSTRPIPIYSIRALPAGTELIEEKPIPFTILCPDLQLMPTTPTQDIECPEPDIQFMVEVPPPKIGIKRIDPDRGEGGLPFDEDESAPAGFRQTAQKIQTLMIPEQERLFLLARHYAQYGFYREALSKLEREENITNPALLRLIAELYIETGSDGYEEKAADYSYQALKRSEAIGDLEGQAIAGHYLALLLEVVEQTEEAEEFARNALELYRELGYTDDEEFLKESMTHF